MKRYTLSVGLVLVMLAASALPALGTNTVAETQKLVASDGAAGARYGKAVAVDGDTAVVGTDGRGAYVYVRSGGVWTETAKLVSSDGTGGGFGASVDLRGETVVVGPYGGSAAYVFEKGSGWSSGSGNQTAKLTNSAGTGFNSVSLDEDGDTVVIGAWWTHSAYVFEKPAQGWSDMTETATLTGSDAVAGSFFGNVVSVSGDATVVGAPRANAAYVFEKPAAGWGNMTETAKLTGSDSAGGWFGMAAAISGDTVVVGTNYRNAVYVFDKPASGWSDMTAETAKLWSSDGDNYWFGWPLALSGDTLLAADHYEEAAYLFERQGSTWTETAKLVASDGPAGRFGYGVGVDEHTAIVGADYDDDKGQYSGSAYVYSFSQPPVADAGGPYDGDEGSPISLDGSGSSDPDGDALVYAWSVDNPGACSFNDASAPEPSLTCSDNGTFEVTLTVDDGTKDPVSDNATVTVNNAPPTAADDVASTSEGGPAVLVEVLANDSDPAGTSDPLTVSGVDVTGTAGAVSFTASDLTYDPNGQFESLAAGETTVDSFGYSIDDGDGGMASAIVSVTVDGENDTPAVAAANASITVNEGLTAANSGTFSDVDASDSVTISASVGDITQEAGNSGNWSWTFDTADGLADSQTVTITAEDGHGGLANTTFDLTVNNVAPTIENLTVPGQEPVNINEQSSFSVDVSFSDPAGALDEYYTCVFDMNNDGLNIVIVADVTGTSCSAPLNYASPGVYTVKVTVTDKDLGSVSATATDYIVIYDPIGGFVTGGGWIMSPEGACPRCPSSPEGKASFGFVSKYKKGADTLTGQTQFPFKAGDLKFHSSSYEWLVIAGANAKYKGVGTINGEGTYKFMLTATDGALLGGGKADEFRIRIWDDNGLYYDNNKGVGEEEYGGTVLGGGNIVIHKAKK